MSKTDGSNYLSRSEKRLHQSILDQVIICTSSQQTKILDLSCGDGILLSELSNLGHECIGTRFKEEDYILKGAPLDPRVTIIKNIDLSQKLPFPDQSFDIIILKEVIEHIPSHLSIISEISRILKEDGYLILSSPNIHRLHSRWAFFVSGTHKLKRRRLGWELDKQDIYSYHYNPVDFTILHSLLFLHNLKVLKLPFTSIKMKYIYYILLYPIVLLGCLFEYRAGSKRAAKSHECERDLCKKMMSFSILFAEHLLVV